MSEYKPYRKRPPSKARGPILSPEVRTTYPFELDHGDPANQIPLLTLAQSSARYLGKLGMPEVVEIAFGPLGRNNSLLEGEMAPSDEELYIKAAKTDTHEYAVQAQVQKFDDIVESANYTLWQPERTGFVVPWGIHLESSARTVYPRQRAQLVTAKSSMIKPTAAIHGVSSVLTLLTREDYRLRTVEQILPIEQPLIEIQED